MAKTKTLIVTVLMFVMLFISLGLFWGDILQEIGNWAGNFWEHHYTGALFFSLGIGGLLYWMITVRRGWQTVPLMVFWFLLTWVGLFIMLFAVTTAGTNAHIMLNQIVTEAVEAGDFTVALKPIAVLFTLPLTFLFFALGGFKFLAGIAGDVDPTGIVKTGTAGGGDAAKQERHNRNRYRASNTRMKQKLRRK